VETRKARHVGRHGERHTGLVVREREVMRRPRLMVQLKGKPSNYSSLSQSYVFVPIAAETMGAISRDGIDFLCEVGRRITQSADDHRESTFLFQRLSVLIQCYNAVSVFGTFTQ